MDNFLNSLSNLFSGSISEWVDKLSEFEKNLSDKYNDFIDIKKYDLDTQEGYENFIKDAAELRKEISAGDSIFSPYLLKLLDNSVKYAMNSHTDKEAANKADNETKEIDNKQMVQENNTVQNIINTEVSRNKKENNNLVKENEPHTYPGDMLTSQEKRNIWKLVYTYIDEMIMPYIDNNVDDNTINGMENGLFEFAAWLLKK